MKLLPNPHLCIRHFVYAYAFGDGLVNALYAVYKNSPAGFEDKYFEMLKAGLYASGAFFALSLGCQ